MHRYCVKLSPWHRIYCFHLMITQYVSALTCKHTLDIQVVRMNTFLNVFIIQKSPSFPLSAVSAAEGWTWVMSHTRRLLLCSNGKLLRHPRIKTNLESMQIQSALFIHRVCKNTILIFLWLRLTFSILPLSFIFNCVHVSLFICFFIYIFLLLL